MIPQTTFIPSDLEVIRIRASKSFGSDKHIHWHVGYAPEIMGGASPVMRVVVADLHVGGEGGYGDITVASVFTHNDDAVNDSNMSEAVAHSYASETLYDYARSHLSGLLATVGIAAELPQKGPDPEVTTLQRGVDDDEGGDDTHEASSE